MLHDSRASRAAVLNTDSSIGGVSFFVFVFWRLGWYRRDHDGSAGQMAGEPVPEWRLRPSQTVGRAQAGARVRQQPPRRVEGDAAERDNHAETPERRDFGNQVRMACGNLCRQRLVIGRRAAHGCRDPDVLQLEPVVDPARERLIRETVRVERGHQEVARAATAVAGEGSPRPVGAVRRGREGDEQDPGVRVAKSRHGLSPVGLVTVGGSLLAGDQLTVVPQPRAPAAGDDGGPGCREIVNH